MFAHRPIPDDFERLAPGPDLGTMLAGIDMSRLDVDDLVAVIQAHARVLSHHQARVYAGMNELVARYLHVHGDPELAHDGAAMEVAPALRLTRRTATSEIVFATSLHDRLPDVADLLDRGAIDTRRARAISHETEHLPAADAAAVVDQIIDDAPRLTTGQLRARIRRLSIEVGPEKATERYSEAVERQRLITQQTPDGTIDLLGLDLPADRSAAISRRIDRIARSLRGPDEDRTMDQLRSDVFIDLLEGRAFDSDSARAIVDITVPLETLVGLSEEPGELHGFGPVVADVARRIVSGQTAAEWRVTVTDSRSGDPIHVGTTRRRPDAGMRRGVEARHRRCVFPGCRMPATQSDIDHTTPWAQGGSTNPDDLAPLCRYHHVRRHLYGWSYARTTNGDILWRSPFGLRYLNRDRAP